MELIRHETSETRVKRYSKALLLTALAVCFPFLGYAQTWDAATCYDICNIVYNDGRNIDEVLQGKYGYKMCDNLSVIDGYMSLYYKNCDVDREGNLISLSRQGVSSVIMVHVADGTVEMAFAVFNVANAKKFLNQALELGFGRLSRIGGNQKYILENIVMEEFRPDKVGRYTYYSYKFSKGF